MPEIHVCSSLRFNDSNNIGRHREHKRAHLLLPSFNAIYVFKKVLCAVRILIQINITTTFRRVIRRSGLKGKLQRCCWLGYIIHAPYHFKCL